MLKEASLNSPVLNISYQSSKIGQKQYVPDSIGAVMYWSDLGLGGDPFYKVEVVGWYVVKQASLVTMRG